MKPFDLEKALAGEPIKVIGTTDKKHLIGKSAFHENVYIVEDEWSAYTRRLDDLKNGFEMWQEPRPRVQLDLPAPLKAPQEGMYIIGSGFEVRKSDFKEGYGHSTKAFAQGRYFATKEDAQEWLDAMRNARR